MQGDQLYHLLGELPLSQETIPSVWINDDSKFSIAELIIDKYKKTEAENISEEITWTCPSCGEGLYEQFTSCWKCGTLREGK